MVADTGVGVRPAKQHAIFAPFEQEDDSTTRKYGGTGLGLEICAKLVAIPAIAGPAPENLRVLLAEDNPVNRILAIRVLERRGHTVLVAENGREVLEILARERVDAILMDIRMPEMDGFQATAAHIDFLPRACNAETKALAGGHP